MRDTGYFIRNNYIYGPSFGGQFYIQGNYIYGPRNGGRFCIDSGGLIYGPSGQLTSFRIQGTSIMGPDQRLPWLE